MIGTVSMSTVSVIEWSVCITIASPDCRRGALLPSPGGFSTTA